MDEETRDFFLEVSSLLEWWWVAIMQFLIFGSDLGIFPPCQMREYADSFSKDAWSGVFVDRTVFVEIMVFV